MKQIIRLVMILVMGWMLTGSVWASEYKYPNGVFTNISGCGVQTFTSPPSCHSGLYGTTYCDLSSKSCSKDGLPNNTVFKYVCDGMDSQCVLNESNGDSASVGEPGCGKTVQIDVFDHDCRDGVGPAGTWSCGLPLDYFVYYTGDCPAITPIPCNASSVIMSVSPDPVSADNREMHFRITSGAASLHVENSWSGGVVNCDQSNWTDLVCRSATAGEFQWTHKWRVCEGTITNCSVLCDKSIGYKINPANIIDLSPKSCRVSVGATISEGEPVVITASGEGNMGIAESRPEPVRLWLERADGGVINPLPIGAGKTSVSPITGNIYYQINECISNNDQPCDLSKSVMGLTSGAYFVHCDLPTDPEPPIDLGTGRCSGNPFCPTGLMPPLAAGDARASVINRETCADWVYCNAVGRQDRDYFLVKDAGPVGVGITIRNSGNTIVPVETGDKNQICQTTFKSAGVHDRRVKFSVTVSDASGGETINKVSLRLTRGAVVKMQVKGVGLTTMAPTYLVTGGGASLYETPTKSVSGDKLTVTFPIQFTETFGAPFAVDSLQIWAEDETKQSSEWTDGGRKFKVWDCGVPVSGIVYDGSDAPLGPVCPTDGYSTLVEAGVFTSLTYVNLISGNKVMTKVGDPGYFGLGNNFLIWGGGSYATKFNDEDELPGSAPIAKLGDKNKSPVPYTCPVTVAAISISQTEIDAYQNEPEATIDFSFTANQGPWYQTVSGGRLGAGTIQSMVPPTCNVASGCTPALSMESTSGTNGVVIAGGGINNMTGCGDCKNGIPNDWYKKSKNITDGSMDYEGLKTLYYDRKGIGKVVSGGNWSLVKSEAGANKVIFVDGNLTIDANNTVLTGDFLMVIVKGLVTVNETVTKFDGMIVTDGAVKAIGKNADTLDLNGSIYARGGFVNGRSLGNNDENNVAPSVKVNYRPDFIFSMPAKLAENVYNWREGN